MSDKPPSNAVKKFDLSEPSEGSMRQMCEEILRNDCDWHNGRGPIVLNGKNYFVTYSINIYRPALADYEDKS